jgi:hypothetical protein
MGMGIIITLDFKTNMKWLRFFTKKKKKENSSDFYQEAVNKIGQEQFKKLLERGLRVPVALA